MRLSASNVRASIDTARQTSTGRARLIGLAGVGLVLTGIVLHMLVMVPLVSLVNPEITPVSTKLAMSLTVTALMALLALLGILMPLRSLSVLVLLVAFVGSFVAGLGWYFILTPSPLALAGLGAVLYFVSAGLMVAAARPSHGHREEN